MESNIPPYLPDKALRGLWNREIDDKGSQRPKVDDKSARGGPHPGQRTRYEIKDLESNTVAVHVRIDFPNKTKRFAWEQADGTLGLSGIPVEELPLYGTELLSSLPDGSRIMVTEGEKAADALRNAGIPAVGTVTGASGTPSTEALRPLARLRPVLWPDNDDVGRNHMERIAARLAGLSTPTKLIKCVDAPENGDAHDFLVNRAGVEELNRLVATAQPFAVPGLASVLDDIVAHNKQYLPQSVGTWWADGL